MPVPCNTFVEDEKAASKSVAFFSSAAVILLLFSSNFLQNAQELLILLACCFVGAVLFSLGYAVACAKAIKRFVQFEQTERLASINMPTASF